MLASLLAGRPPSRGADLHRPLSVPRGLWTRRKPGSIVCSRAHCHVLTSQRRSSRSISAQAGDTGNSSTDGPSGVPGIARPWPAELIGKMKEAVNRLGGPSVPTPQALLEAVDWPGLTEADTAAFLQAAIEIANSATGNGKPTMLHMAAEAGRLDQILELLQLGFGANVQDSTKATPLHCAAVAGQSAAIQVLVKHGADMEICDCNGFTPLATAALNSRIAACKELVALGARLDSCDSEGDTVLMVAAHADDNGQAVRALLELGACVNEQNAIDGQTALHVASAIGATGAARTLLELGADLEATDNGGGSPLHCAAEAGQSTAIQMLVQHGADLEARDGDGSTPLAVAAINGNVSACKDLVGLGASLGSRDAEGDTVLMAAAHARDNGETIRALVELGACVNERNAIDGQTALHVAASLGAAGADRALLELGADLEATDNQGDSPLHLAVLSDHPESAAVVQLLVQARASQSALDDALHLAIPKSRVYIMELLLGAGADLYAVRHGWTAVIAAVEWGHPEVLDFLLRECDLDVLYDDESDEGSDSEESSDDADDPAASAAAFLSVFTADGEVQFKELLCLLQQDFDPNVTLDEQRHTPLHSAAKEGAVGAIRVLVKHQAALDAQDSDGNTPLHLAARSCQPGACRELVALGANVNASNQQGQSPLMLAACEDDSGDCVRALLLLGADVQACDNGSETALYMAARHSRLGAVKALLEAGAPVSTGDARGILLNTALHITVATTGNMEVVQALLSAGAEPNSRDENGYTPSQLASRSGKVELELLLRHAELQANQTNGA